MKPDNESSTHTNHKIYKLFFFLNKNLRLIIFTRSNFGFVIIFRLGRPDSVVSSSVDAEAAAAAAAAAVAIVASLSSASLISASAVAKTAIY